MNKYIRVIEDSEEYITTRENLHDHILALQDSGFDFEGGIIKEADTIEEICDEFVDIDNHDYYKITRANGNVYVLSKTKRFIGHYDIRLKEIGQIMGAIWTDKGLIYVAKMNDKGELELL